MARAQAERDRLRPTDRHGSLLPPYRSRSLRKRRRRRRRRTEPTPPPPLALTRSLSPVALSDIHAVSRYSLYSSSSSSDSPSGSSLPTHKGEKEEGKRGRTLRGIAERKDGFEEERESKRQIGLLSFFIGLM